MSTRNPMNKRSQEQMKGERKGMTRKSTASAKPARAAAGSVRVVASSGKAKRKQMEQGESLAGLSREEKKARKQARRMQEDRIYTASQALMKEDAGYVKARRVFWIMVVACLVCLGVAWTAMAISASNGLGGAATAIQVVSLVLGYVLIFAALVFDFVKVRPVRKECRAIAEGMSDAKLSAVIERAAKAEDEKRAARRKKK